MGCFGSKNKEQDTSTANSSTTKPSSSSTGGIPELPKETQKSQLASDKPVKATAPSPTKAKAAASPPPKPKPSAINAVAAVPEDMSAISPTTPEHHNHHHRTLSTPKAASSGDGKKKRGSSNPLWKWAPTGISFDSFSPIHIHGSDWLKKQAKGEMPGRLPFFQGRLQEFNETVSNVREKGFCALTGIGGVGKTSLAIEVAHHLMGNGYKVIGWIDSEFQEEFASDLVTFAKFVVQSHVVDMTSDLASKSAGELAKYIYDDFKNREGWCFVFDGVVDFESISKYLPAPKVDKKQAVIVTSRYTHSWPGPQINLNGLSQGDSIQLLWSTMNSELHTMEDGDDTTVGSPKLKALSPKTTTNPIPTTSDFQATAKALHAYFEGNPLMITAVGIYLARHSMSMSELDKQFRDDRSFLFWLPGPHAYSVYSTTSLAEVMESQLMTLAAISPSSVSVLSLAAFLAPAPIPMSIFNQTLPDITKKGLLSAWEAISSFSLAKQDLRLKTTGSTHFYLTLEPLVQGVMRGILSHTDGFAHHNPMSTCVQCGLSPIKGTMHTEKSSEQTYCSSCHTKVSASHGSSTWISYTRASRECYRAIDAVASLWSFNWRDPSTWAANEEIVDHLDAVIDSAQELNVALDALPHLLGSNGLGGYYQYHEKDLPKAKGYYKEAVESAISTYGPKSIQTGIAYANLGAVYGQSAKDKSDKFGSEPASWQTSLISKEWSSMTENYTKALDSLDSNSKEWIATSYAHGKALSQHKDPSKVQEGTAKMAAAKEAMSKA